MRTRPDTPAARTSATLFAAVSDDVLHPVVLGLGRNPGEARQNAARQLEVDESNAAIALLEVHPISDAEAAVVQAGNPTWPIVVEP